MVNISLRVELNSDFLSCVRIMLELKPEDKLDVEYKLQLSSGEGVIISRAKKMNISNIYFEREGELYYSRIAIDNDIKPGKYYIVLYTLTKMLSATNRV